jgi:potassium efflux system protein
VISDEIDRILYARRDLLEALLARYERSLDAYRQLGFIDQQISIKAQEYKDYLEQELLWLQDSEIVGVRELMNLPEAISWFAGRQKWGRVVENVQAAFWQQTVLWVIVLSGGTLLLASRRWRYRKLVLLSKNVGHTKNDSIFLTLRGLFLTLILAADVPSVMGFVGYQLTLVSESQEFSTAIGKGLINAAVKLVQLRFLLQLFRENGLAQLHFGWKPEIGASMHRMLLWLMWLVVPAAFLYASLQESLIIDYTDSLGRLAYMMMMLSGGLFTAWLLRPSGALFTTLKRQASESLIVRAWPIWYVLAIGILFCLGGIAAVGYYYTALILDQPVQRTIILALVLIITSNILVRWLLIRRRRMEHDQFLKHQEEQTQAVEGAQADTANKVTGTDGEAVAVQPPTIDYGKIEDQYMALLRFITFIAASIGLWVIWAEGLPVLNTLQNFEIWSYSVGSGDEIRTITVTLEDLLISIIVATTMVVTALNLPGILEVTIFSRLKPDIGTRNFIVTLSRFIVIGIAVFVTFQTIGLHWSKLHWLIAALGVGLGFGLQEIVANFVSGIILLIERPYRVGDVVTVGAVSGTVTNIQIRATTVTDWDLRELIVPNKEFIAGQLINWSLSDPITRIVIPVGIAYGSDTELAEQLILKVARKHTDVLEKPEPTALFISFGDSSLQFELRVFIVGTDRRMIVRHELHRGIDQIFKEHGINIAFPQQDVHMDTTRPLDVRLVKETKDTNSDEKPLESSGQKKT